MIQRTRKQRLDELKQFISLCFAMWEGTHAELAARANLCPATIWRLFHGNYTLAIRFNTFQSLAYSVGLKVELEEGDVLVTLVK